MDTYAIIVAGGAGVRMGPGLPKQFLLLRERPVIWYTVTAFLHAIENLQVILVLPEAFLDIGKDIIATTPDPKRVTITTGGPTRFHSVQYGLDHVPVDSVVFVHDGVRCLITTQLIRRCFEATLVNGNAIPAVSAVDTIRIATSTGSDRADRTKIKLVQTPQTFMAGIIKKAYQQEYQEGFTDDASVVESSGEKIFLIEGEVTNIKITRQIDLVIAEQLLREREVFR